MKKAIFQIILMVLCFTAQGQKVSNSRAEQRGQDIVVFYSLETSSPCEVSLLLSQDNGTTWSSPLKNVTGDVGKNIAAGEKQITWRVLEERDQLVGDQIRFKVVANGKKSFEPELVFVEGKTDKAEKVFTFVSEMPSFPGGDGELFNLINSNVSYPERAKQQNIEGTVYIRFVVEADGIPSNFEVERGVDGGEMLDAEALRVCQQVLPKIKWNPGKQNGRAVRVWTRLPIRFILPQ